MAGTHARRTVTVTVLALALLVGCAAAVGQQPVAGEPQPVGAAQAPDTARGTVAVSLTFYGGLDNDPPGSSDIAYPNSRHPEAGGTGTAIDPITLATDPRELPPGTTVYIPRYRKYFVMEDECAACIDGWNAGQGNFDLWTAPAGDGLLACEQALTPDEPVPVEINPPANRTVDLRPLYDATTGVCWSGS